MDPENDEERREEQENNHLLGFLKKGTKKAKSVFIMIFRKIIAAIGAKLIIILLAILAVVAVILAFATIMDKLKDNLEAGHAASSILQDENVVSIESTSSGEYYFKISQDVVDKYLEGIDEASTKDLFGEAHGVEDDEVVDSEEEEKEEIAEEDKTIREDIDDWFTVEDFDEYLVKMLRAEIASSYPKLSNYTGEDGTEDDQGNKKDADGDYVAQGVVKIHRQMMNKDGTVGDEFELQYLPYDNFMALVQANDSSALNYFSFVESSGLLYYATYVEEIVTVNGVETSRTYTLSSSSVSYKALTTMCSMPYNFLFSLLQTSENPNYVMAVIDLLLEESDVVLMIQDQLSTTIYTEVNYQAEKTETQVLTGEESRYRNGNTTSTRTYWVYGATNTTYSFPAGAREEIVTTTYRNTANVYIKKAYTWCIDFEQEATLKSESTQGEEVLYTYEEGELSGRSYTLASSNRNNIPSASDGSSFTIIEKYLSDSNLLYSTKTDTENYTWNTSVLTEKRINYERFLGLWKNDKGEYYQGCLFDPDGKEVEFDLASEKSKEVAVEKICDNDETIGELLSMLELHDDTEIHEQLMMYYWNVYMGRDIYNVDIDGLLNLFSTNSLSSGSSGVLISADGIEATVWYSLKSMGYSDYSVAGVMGNIWAESRFDTSAINSSSGAYGLCQWLGGRKTGLESYAAAKGVDASDAYTQVEYLMAELTQGGGANGYATYQFMTTKYGGVVYRPSDWLNATDVSTATTVFCYTFERPGERRSKFIGKNISCSRIL